MKSVFFDVPGDPSTVLRSADVAKPVPGKGEVLVRMLASPINPSDLMFVRGVYGIQPQCPQSPGFEGVGVVEASGGGIRGSLFEGRRVVVMNARGGNWAQYAVVPATQVIPVSKKLTDDQAAVFFVNPATAWILTREILRVPTGEWLIQTAAGSTLGHMVARLGRHYGFRTLCIVRRDQYRESLSRAGATAIVVFDPETESAKELQEKIRDAAGGRHSGCCFAIDAVGGPLTSAFVPALGPGARLVLFGTLSDQPIHLFPRAVMQHGMTIEGFWLGRFLVGKGLLFRLNLVRRITRLIRSGILGTEVGGRFDFDHVVDAVRMAEDRSVSGKVLLSP